MQKRARAARRALAAQGLVEAVTWSFVSKEQARGFRRRRRRASRSPIRSPPISPTCGRACCRASSPPPAATPRAALAIARCSRSGRSSPSDDEKGQRIAAAGVRRGLATTPAPGALVGARAAQGRRLRRQGRRHGAAAGARRRDRRLADRRAAGRPGSIPAARERCNSAPRRSSAISASCIRALLGDSTSRGRSRLSRSISTLCRRQRPSPPRPSRKLELSDLQPLSRDFAFVVDRAAPAGDLVKAVLGADKALIVSADVFDVYEGVGVPEGKKSVGVAVTLQPQRENPDRRGDRGGGAENRRRGGEENRRDAARMRFLREIAVVGALLAGAARKPRRKTSTIARRSRSRWPITNVSRPSARRGAMWARRSPTSRPARASRARSERGEGRAPTTRRRGAGAGAMREAREQWAGCAWSSRRGDR